MRIGAGGSKSQLQIGGRTRNAAARPSEDPKGLSRQSRLPSRCQILFVPWSGAGLFFVSEPWEMLTQRGLLRPRLEIVTVEWPR